MRNSSLIPPTEPEASRPEGREEAALVPHRTDWLGVGQFVFSALAALLLPGFALLTLALSSLALPGAPLESDLSTSLFVAGLAGMGLLMAPSAYAAGRRLFGSRAPRPLPWKKFAPLVYLALPLILLGAAIQQAPDWARRFLPLVHVLANTAAVFWLLGLARRQLPDQSASRFWGTIAAGLGLTPLVTFILEILILIGIGLAWSLLLGAMPAFRQDLVELAGLLQSSSPNPQELELALGQFAAAPGVLLTLFGYVAVLIPLVEELLKPAAVWLLLGRRLQPWEGFVIGATSGAGYALFENLTIGAAAEVWTFVTLTRLGTAAVHIFTTGLVGWGLAWAFPGKRYGRLAAAFAAAAALHGLWNGLNILSAVGGYPAVGQRLGSLASGLADYAPAALALLALGSVGGILRANKSFRRAIMAGSNSSSEAAWK